MKTKLLTNKSLFLALVFASVVLFIHPVHASAATTQATSTSPPVAYTYIARPGDNMSIMVRRSIQLYAAAKKIKLTPAMAMYCETNTVQKIGGHLLNVGESVNVPFNTLQKYIASGRKLTTAQQASWNAWAQLASFDLDGLNPTNKTKAQAVATSKTSSATTKTPSKQTSNTQTNKSKSTFDKLTWYGWIALAAFVLATGYYFTLLKD